MLEDVFGKDIYWGIDVGQMIFAFIIFVIFIGFAVWAFRTQARINELERKVHRDFRELEEEDYEEESAVDAFSEGAMLEADDRAAREEDILEHGS